MPRRFKERFKIFFSGGGAVQSPDPQLPVPPMRERCLVAVSQTQNYSKRAGVGSKSTPQHLLLQLLNSIYKGFS